MPTRSASKTVTRHPDWSGPAISPGEMLLEEFLKPLGLNQAEAAQRLGISANRLNEVVLAKRRITADTARRFSRLFGTSPQFWMRLQSDWDLASSDGARPNRVVEHEPRARVTPEPTAQPDAPKVFISYSHDSEQHKAWVRKLAADLRISGVDAILDQWDLVPGQDIVDFVVTGIAFSTRVILVCTDTYVERANRGTGGVGYERLVVTSELVDTIDTRKFLPVARHNSVSRKLPAFLGPRVYVDFSDDTAYAEKLEQVIREIHGTPGNAKPPLGTNPFAGAPPASSGPRRLAGPAGVTSAGYPILDDEWYEKQHAVAQAGLKRLALPGSTELRFALHDPTHKSQVELLNAVQKSGIQTFGWPIGIVLPDRDDLRPRPTADGIVAEVAIPEDAGLGRPSYDYWTLRNNGDFYLLQSLFEDTRSEQRIFFDTRVVRVTEALMFCSNLYANLDVAPEAGLGIRVTHRGLTGRLLSCASRARHVFPATIRDDVATSDVNTSIADLREQLTDRVIQILEPMFMLFDFRRFDRSVYNEIVRKFASGSC